MEIKITDDYQETFTVSLKETALSNAHLYVESGNASLSMVISKEKMKALLTSLLEALNAINLQP